MKVFRDFAALGFLIAVLASTGCMHMVSITRSKHSSNRVKSDGIYDHDTAALGTQFGMAAPPGFSYEIQYDGVAAAANGDTKHYDEVDEMSKADVSQLEETYTTAILDGLRKAISQTAPNWVDGKAVGVVKPNYYPGDTAAPIDLTLKKDAFPYDASKPASKELHEKLLQAIKDHWGDITN
jgi:hypothetical protein